MPKLSPSAHRSAPVRTEAKHFSQPVEKAQEQIYSYLLGIVKTWEPQDVLTEFKQLFIHHQDTLSSETLPSLYRILFLDREQEFKHTLKRSCYILINNWEIARQHKPIQQLVQLFQDPILDQQTVSPTLQRLRSWVKDFKLSQDFQELKLFAARYDDRQKLHWTERYTPYLLVSQSMNRQNPLEQRQAARLLARQLKDRFKFELAMYTAHLQNPLTPKRYAKNPTLLGDEVLRLVKRVLVRKGFFNHANLAHIFQQQTQNLTYRHFKRSLIEYLTFSIEYPDLKRVLKQQLQHKLNSVLTEFDRKPVDEALHLRTICRVVAFLTTEDRQEPSPLFVQLLSEASPLTLVSLLVKLILACPQSRSYLEARVADLIQYYKGCPEEDCEWVISFFEILSVVMAIHTENIEYNLVNMKQTDAASTLTIDSETYRIFSRAKEHLWFDPFADLASSEG